MIRLHVLETFSSLSSVSWKQCLRGFARGFALPRLLRLWRHCRAIQSLTYVDFNPSCVSSCVGKTGGCLLSDVMRLASHEHLRHRIMSWECCLRGASTLISPQLRLEIDLARLKRPEGLVFGHRISSQTHCHKLVESAPMMLVSLLGSNQRPRASGATLHCRAPYFDFKAGACPIDQ